MRAPSRSPFLFFGVEDLPALRRRADRSPFDACLGRIRASAVRLGELPIPNEPEPGPLAARDRDGYTDSFLQAHYDYMAAGQALQGYGQILAFAYLLDGDVVAGEQARRWVVSMARWNSWGPAADPYGHAAAPALAGTALLYDWLAGLLEEAEKEMLRLAMRRQIQAMLSRWPAAAGGAALGGSSVWSCLGAAGLGALALLGDGDEAAGWAGHWAGLFRDRVLPASFAADGAYQEGAGWWDLCALRAGLPFFAALRRCGGPDLYADAGLRAYPDFLLQTSRAYERGAGPQADSWARFLPPSPLHYRWVLLHLAGEFGDGRLAEAAGSDLDVPEGTPLDWFFFYGRRRPYETDRWYTVELSWDAAQKSLSLAVDGVSWQWTVDRPDLLNRVDGLRFGGGGLRLRHLGLSPEGREAVALLEEETELTLGRGDVAAGAVLEAPGLRLRFAPAASGTVWFQACKTDNREAASVHLAAGEVRGPGMRLESVGLFPDLGADFRFADGEGNTWPPGAERGGRVWFDGPWEYLWRDGLPAPVGPDPRQSGLFAASGLALLRAGERPQVEMRLRAGPAAGRDRGDQNAFVLSLDGRPLSGDLPEPASGESRPGRRQHELGNFFLNTFACNAPLVDGRPQERAGFDEQWGREGKAAGNGRLLSFFSAPAFDAVVGEAGQAYSGLNLFRRAVVFVKPDYFFIADHIEADPGRRIEWLLHATGSLQGSDGHWRLEAGTDAAEAFVLEPADARGETRRTPAPLEEEQTPYLCLPLEGGARVSLVLVPLPGGGETELRPERQAARGGGAVRLRRGNGTDLLLCRDPSAEAATADGVRGDGEVSLLRRERDQPVLYALVGGRRLQWRTELVGFEKGGSVAVQRSASRLRAWVDAPDEDVLRLHVGARPRFVRLDGQRLDAAVWNYSPQGRRLSVLLDAGVHELDVALK